MKHYEKKYENIYTAPSHEKWCKISKVGTTIGLSGQELAEAIRSVSKELTGDFFLNTVKLEWLIMSYHYGDQLETKKQVMRGGAFNVFTKNIAGVDVSLFRNLVITDIIRSYIPSFFPDFMENNPFKAEDKFKLPYKHVSLDFLIPVYNMDERMELLDEAENKKMSFAQFMDYLINYVGCLNEELGENKYEFLRGGKASERFPSYFINNHRRKKKI